MYRINIKESLSKIAFLKENPILYYGKSEDYFAVITPDGKVCALSCNAFPGFEGIMKRFAKHKLEKRPIRLSTPLPCLLIGTPLQQQVWKALLEIPKGKTVTYQELAQKVGKPKAYRAVANAVGANPISPLIPCHRVIRKGGALGGYYWGTDIKEKLLAEEQSRN